MELQKKVSLAEIWHLYVEENYSMDLLAKTIGIPLNITSRILQKYDIPQKKQEYYDARGGMPPELKQAGAKRIENAKKRRQIDIEDEFFGE